MKKQKIFTFILAFFATFPVNASLCKYLNSKRATQAFERLINYKKERSIAIVDKYCEACGDTYVEPLVLEEITYRPYDVKGFASIGINGKERDLAFLYLEGENLGHKYGCKAANVHASLFSSLKIK